MSNKKLFISSIADIQFNEQENGTLIKGIEAFRAGEWRGKIYSITDLKKMASNFRKLKNTATLEPPMKVDHSESAENQIGWVKKLYVEGDTLLADVLVTEPYAVEKIERGTWKKVSAEIYSNFVDDSTDWEYGMTFRALSIVSIPHLKNIKSIALNSESLESFEEEQNKKTGVEGEMSLPDWFVEGERIKKQAIEEDAKFAEMYKDTYKNLDYSPKSSFSEKPKEDKGFITLANGQTIEVDYNSFDYAKIEEHVKDSEKFVQIGESDYISLDAIHQFKPAQPVPTDGNNNRLDGKDLVKNRKNKEKYEDEALDQAKDLFYDEEYPEAFGEWNSMKQDDKK